MAMYLGTNRVAVTNEGGGSSDFSTCTITVTNTLADTDIFINGLSINSEEEIMVDEWVVEVQESRQFVLYKGSARIYVGATVTSVSGSITHIDGGTYEITGDCSIVGRGWGVE